MGDPYFPFAGNGGYDVKNYDLDLDYTLPPPAPAPLVGRLDGVATISLVATQNLDRFNLDLRGMDVTAITVNGKRVSEVAPPAAGARVGGAAYWQVQDDAARVWELTIQPWPKLKKGQRAKVVVTYGGADHPANGHRGRALRLGHHPRRRHGGQRTRGLDDLVPGQRPPDRQGDLRLRDHRA